MKSHQLEDLLSSMQGQIYSIQSRMLHCAQAGKIPDGINKEMQNHLRDMADRLERIKTQ